LSVVSATATGGEEALTMLRNLALRPIERLSFRSDAVLPLHQIEIATLFLSFENTLTHLSWEASEAFSLEPVDTIIEVTAQLPKLKFFSWFSDDFPQIPPHDQKRLLNAISMLVELESLLLEANFETTHADVSDIRDPFHATRETANAFMSSCPALDRIAFAIQPHDLERRAYLCYAKTRSGKLALKGYGILNKSSWREI